MPPSKMSHEALQQIQKLIQANFTGRDELYAAAASLDDTIRERICRRLADHLAGHAADLQQIVAATGAEPAGPLDVEALAQQLFELAKANRGDAGVLGAAAEGEQLLKENYDAALSSGVNPQTQDILRRQREHVQHGEKVLRSISEPAQRGSTSDHSQQRGSSDAGRRERS